MGLKVKGKIISECFCDVSLSKILYNVCYGEWILFEVGNALGSGDEGEARAVKNIYQ